MSTNRQQQTKQQCNQHTTAKSDESVYVQKLN